MAPFTFSVGAVAFGTLGCVDLFARSQGFPDWRQSDSGGYEHSLELFCQSPTARRAEVKGQATRMTLKGLNRSPV